VNLVLDDISLLASCLLTSYDVIALVLQKVIWCFCAWVSSRFAETRFAEIRV